MRSTGSAPRFADALTSALGEPAPIRFSRHAEERMRARGLSMSSGDLARLSQAMEEAAARGARDSLVLDGSRAYVVNVPSRTVVTALYGDQAKQHIFTQIDSAVVI